MKKSSTKKSFQNRRKEFKEKFKSKSKLTIGVYVVLRLFVILSMIFQSIHGNWSNVFLCALTLILFTLPTIISDKINIELPSFLEITVYLFIFAAEILGEIQNFYGIFKYWDTMLHTLNGFLCAAIGFSLVDILNREDKFRISMTPSYLAIVAFCFSMTIGVLWEFYEFGADYYLHKDMQKDRIVNVVSSVKINGTDENPPEVLKDITETRIYSDNGKTETIIKGGYLDIGIIDTMKDLFVNFIGAIIFSTIGYIYVKNRKDSKLINNFVPKLKRNSK